MAKKSETKITELRKPADPKPVVAEKPVKAESNEVQFETSIPGYSSVEQVANETGLSKATIVNLCKAGKIKTAKIGGVYFIPDLEKAKIESVRGNTRSSVNVADVVKLPFTCPHCAKLIESLPS